MTTPDPGAVDTVEPTRAAVRLPDITFHSYRMYVSERRTKADAVTACRAEYHDVTGSPANVLVASPATIDVIGELDLPADVVRIADARLGPVDLWLGWERRGETT